MKGVAILVGTVAVLVVVRAVSRGADLGGDMCTALKHDIMHKGGRRPRRHDDEDVR